MSNIKLTITKITQGAVNGNQIITMKSQEAGTEVTDVLGVKVLKDKTYYASRKTTNLVVGQEIELSREVLDKAFVIDFNGVDKNTGDPFTAKLKWI